MSDMTECTACGTPLAAHETYCSFCGQTTTYYHRQRRCLHCGTPAAERVETCMMCHNPIDSLPLNKSIFSGSWLTIGLGVLIIIGLVRGANTYQQTLNRPTAIVLQSPTATLTPTVTFTPTPGPTNTPTATGTPTVTPTATPNSHTLQGGETLSYLSELYGVPVAEIMAMNDISDVTTLRIGQTLLIPPATKAQIGDTDSLPSQVVYVIKDEDTLLGVALEYSTNVEAIMALNPDLNPDLIFPGQEIVVPLATPTATNTPTATTTPTFTPKPPYLAPELLSPSEGQLVTNSSLFFNWTATAILAEDEFYVLQLEWADGSQSRYWTKTSSLTLDSADRPEPGSLIWQISIMRDSGGINPDGSPIGIPITDASQLRTVEWR
ncbi:MAG: LysM peptidoglycan-binding domain-containing protein [Chloroflexota bacterium]